MGVVRVPECVRACKKSTRPRCGWVGGWMDGWVRARARESETRRDGTGRVCVRALERTKEGRKDRAFVIVGRRSSRRGRSSVNSFTHSFTD